jgi:hypothetical protein
MIQIPKGKYCTEDVNNSLAGCDKFKLEPTTDDWDYYCHKYRKWLNMENREMDNEKILKCSLCLRNSGGRETKIKGIKRTNQ